MKSLFALCAVAIAVVVLIAVEPAMAGPGGKIARAAFETFWGRVVLGILTVVFLPLIIYVLVQEKIAERRTQRDLRYMASHSPLFEPIKIQMHAKDCFLRVHSGWQDEDLSRVSDWMTDWYWQNQQMVYLDRWKNEGLVNICDVKKIKRLRPLLFVHRNEEGEHEGSIVVLQIEAKMKDFLKNRSTGKVVEGSRRYKDVTTLWTFMLDEGRWKVADIEEDDMTLVYTKMAKNLPSIESTVHSEFEA